MPVSMRFIPEEINSLIKIIKYFIKKPTFVTRLILYINENIIQYIILI